MIGRAHGLRGPRGWKPLGPWAAKAACIRADPRLFDETPQGVTDFRGELDRQMAAARFCVRCPVRALCLEERNRNGHTGVWGGVLFNGTSTGRTADLIARLHSARHRQDALRRMKSAARQRHLYEIGKAA